MALIPAPGNHWFWHAGRPFSVHFQRSDDTKGRSQRRVESLRFQTLGRQQLFLEQFVDGILACHRKKTGLASCLFVYDDYWMAVQAYAPRLLDSVILKPGEKEHLVEDLKQFRASRKRYRHLGVPYHRGYLLYGPPGTGKTSLVSGLAAQFGMGIYVVNLTDFSDRSLKTAINDVPENSVILFEDIDCMKAGDRRTEPDPGSGNWSGKPAENGSTSAVTLSGLLNVLDGFHAPENVVFVMTTNHAGALDPALLRPGSIDYKLFLGEAAEHQKVELYRRFFPEQGEAEAIRFAQEHHAETMAEFQGLLLRLEQGSDAGRFAAVCASG